MCRRKVRCDLTGIIHGFVAAFARNVGRTRELRPRSGERSYDSAPRNSQGHE